MMGPGRLAAPDRIVRAVESLMEVRPDLEGETVLITAGPTQEAIDPVRFISNRSSGKMGYALAEAALARGAKVLLVSGPVQLHDPRGATVIHVRSATEMRNAVMENLEEATIIIKAAAVADYYIASIPQQKLKKTAARLSIELDPTPDILAEAGHKKGDRLLIGFAAETENLVSEARRKLKSKNCDMVVSNIIGQEGIGFEADDNEVVLVMSTGETVAIPRASKRQIADRVFDEALKLRLALHAVQ
jgi:phosphopantothenoylcysteine decarboxylase/phosphopantothenate--cysteine ligase